MSNAAAFLAVNDNASPEAAALRTVECRERENDRITANAAATHYRGAKFDRSRPLRETSTMIRRELAAAGKTTGGPLSGCVCRVTTRRASMMVAIDVEIVNVPERGAPIVNGRWIEAEDSGVSLAGPRPSILSKRGEAMIGAAKAIVDQFNFNKSDSMTDYSCVGFYGGVTFDSDVTAAARAEVRAALALLA
jgi:hexokinase